MHIWGTFEQFTIISRECDFLPCFFYTGELLPASYTFLFQGENDIEQLCCVLRVLGTPDEASWPVRTLIC